MILPMSKVRILGPRPRLEEVLEGLQELGVMHLAPPHEERLEVIALSPRQRREQEYLRRLIEDAETVLALMGLRPASGSVAAAPDRSTLAQWARLAGRLRRTLERLAADERRLTEERTVLQRYRAFFDAFSSLLEESAAGARGFRSYHLILPVAEQDRLPALERLLTERVGPEHVLLTRRVGERDLAVLLLVPEDGAATIDRLLAEAGVHELPLPPGLGAGSLREALPAMRARREAIPAELAAVRARREALRTEHGETVALACAAAHDRLLALAGLAHAGGTAGAFVLEGWVPAATVARVRSRLEDRLGPTVVVEELDRETWAGEPAPVVLTNPRLFRPFELLTSLVPLPRYGSIDPTPFVAVFFPMFFGLILGDIGYGLVLGLLAAVLHRRSRPETTLRAASEVAGACAAFTVLFGLAFGEFFGDAGRHWFGLQPLVFDREEAIVPFLGLAVAIGMVHVVLGLFLGAARAFRGGGREALGRGLSGVMVLLVVAALLAAFEVLPGAFFTPVVVMLLIAFPVLIVLEGVVAPVEFLSTLGSILSYARIMALGTASVLMAVVANRLAGTLGGVVVGALFALLFHLVNFALGVFSPAIHALRLHYVEFFGKFFSPGGVRYEPFGHWRLNGSHAP